MKHWTDQINLGVTTTIDENGIIRGSNNFSVITEIIAPRAEDCLFYYIKEYMDYIKNQRRLHKKYPSEEEAVTEHQEHIYVLCKKFIKSI